MTARILHAPAVALALLAAPLSHAALPQIWVGGDNTCGVANGAAYCWGRNDEGQVGNGTFTTATTPAAVQGLSSGVAAIVTSGAHSCAIVSGAARCWGSNDYGQLGNGAGTDSAVPVAVTGLTSGVTAIAVGDLHSCAVHNGAAKCWGSGGYGQLGTGGSIFSSNVPVAVAGLGSGVADVALGRHHSCAVLASGAVRCWGRGDSGEMGNNTTTYINAGPVAGPTGYGLVSGGNSFTCGVQSGAAYCWGFGSGGRLGNSSNSNVSLPSLVTGLTGGVSWISAGNGNHACALASTGPKCWGANNAGQLGNAGVPGGTTAPAAVNGLPGGVIDISAGGLHTCAATATAIYCWGDNTHGQLGTGNLTGSPSPVLVANIDPPTASNPPRLANISTRMQVQTGDNVMIGGFVIVGAVAKTVAIRARGPSLIPAGITNALADPVLQLFSGQTQIAINDDWQDTDAAAIQASGFAPAEALESTILITLNPGAYTAIVSGLNGTTGVGIVEVFEVDHPEVALVNIATRGRVLTGNDVMIGGFIIQGDGPQTVVVRARGPSLTAAGVPGALANPNLQLFTGQTQIGANDNWQQAANAAAIQASGFAPADAAESAILVTLQPGAYTAIVTGVGNTTGVAIIEVFAN